METSPDSSQPAAPRHDTNVDAYATGMMEEETNQKFTQRAKDLDAPNVYDSDWTDMMADEETGQVDSIAVPPLPTTSSFYRTGRTPRRSNKSK